ncbi:FAD-binding oxidoreductase [Roseibium sp. RKSG952]|uniref:NAD(P)/FAD-dependent oxidoreductase n=1 Tax=Roseibium sp. RKSG952 TaxID=2529384 RepID=UPI0012BCFC7F|nr:FAD-dependent oxidoreductase [Roseibium sp. RKSG952]MTH95632.1 FAD-binding oxidoreductase [Roseibium sp. RKSG952]
MFDIVIIGGGVAGLMSAYKMTRIGLSVALVEKMSTLASGPSTRNEGWLHRGTYHACSIEDRDNALQVAARCIYGHEQLLNFCPEAIEDRDVRPIAMLRDGNRIDDVISRWNEAGVRYRQITCSEASSRCSDADFDRADALFEVNDVSINTRLLYRKLSAKARQAGCVFFLGYDITRIEGTTLTITNSEDDEVTLKGSKIVYTAGGGVRDLFKKFHNVDIPIRYWKSHLVVTQRLSDAGIFYLDAQEAAMMHHGNVSIVGFNEDALLSALPDYEVAPDRANNLRRGIARIFPNWRPNDALDVACVKVDLVDNHKDARSLNIAIREPIENHVVALPGKLTEAPYLTDALIAQVHEAVDDTSISRRPCDDIHDRKVFAA